MARRGARLIRDQKGVTAVEYGLICALIVLAVFGGIQAMGGGKENLWGGVETKVDAAMK